MSTKTINDTNTQGVQAGADQDQVNTSITVALLPSQSTAGSAGKASFADCDNDNDHADNDADGDGKDADGNVNDDEFDGNDDRWIQQTAADINNLQPDETTIHPLPQATQPQATQDVDDVEPKDDAVTMTVVAMAIVAEPQPQQPPSPSAVTKIKTEDGNNDNGNNDTASRLNSGSTTVPTTPTTTSNESNEKPLRKKRKKNKGVGGSYVCHSSSVSTLPLFRNMDDSEFVRIMAVEFKMRGYVVAIQLRPLLEGQQPSIPASGAGANGETTTTTNKDAIVKKGTTNNKKKKTKKISSFNNNIQLTSNLTSNLPNFPFYPSTTSISTKNAKSWNMAFDQLQSYHDDHCGALPTMLLHHTLHNNTNNHNSTNPSNQQHHNPALIKWTKTQLNSWKRIKKDGKHNLSLERICKLHSLNLERQLERGDGGIGGRDGQHGDNDFLLLGNMVDGQKVGIVGDGVGVGGFGFGNKGSGEVMDETVLENQMMLMASMGKNKQKWQEKFDKLRRYKEEYGHTNVPRSYDDGLSKWCATQRLRCKEFMKGNVKTPMTRMQFQALESVGFNMNRKRKLYDRSVLDRKWEEKFNELLQYKEKFGNTDVAVRKGFEEYKQLANWAGLMRRKFKAKQTGTKAGRTTGITDDEIKKLASVGFSFSLQDDFDTRFKHLLEFKKEFGHTKVPVFYTGFNNLGRWAKRMRDGIRLEEPWVDDVRKARLLGIDFDIAARHVFGHKPKKKSEEEEQRVVEVEEEAMEEVMVEDDAVVVEEDEDGMRMAQVLDQPVEAQEVAAAATMARMDNNDFVRPSLPPFGNTVGPHFFNYEKYHGYQHTQP